MLSLQFREFPARSREMIFRGRRGLDPRAIRPRRSIAGGAAVNCELSVNVTQSSVRRGGTCQALPVYINAGGCGGSGWLGDRGWLLKSHSFLHRHADVACPEDSTLPIVRGQRWLTAYPCACVRARVTMPGYRHVRYYGNSLQIKIAYAVDGSERNIRSLDTFDALKSRVTLRPR